MRLEEIEEGERLLDDYIVTCPSCFGSGFSDDLYRCCIACRGTGRSEEGLERDELMYALFAKELVR